MADAFTLAATLPPFLFDAAQSTPIAHPVSATYVSEDYQRMIDDQRLQFADMQRVATLARSGNKEALDRAVKDVQAKISAYHAKNQQRFAPEQAQPVLGMDSSLKNATMKHKQKSEE